MKWKKVRNNVTPFDDSRRLSKITAIKKHKTFFKSWVICTSAKRALWLCNPFGFDFFLRLLTSPLSVFPLNLFNPIISILWFFNDYILASAPGTKRHSYAVSRNAGCTQLTFMTRKSTTFILCEKMHILRYSWISEVVSAIGLSISCLLSYGLWPGVQHAEHAYIFSTYYRFVLFQFISFSVLFRFLFNFAQLF